MFTQVKHKNAISTSQETNFLYQTNRLMSFKETIHVYFYLKATNKWITIL